MSTLPIEHSDTLRYIYIYIICIYIYIYIYKHHRKIDSGTVPKVLLQEGERLMQLYSEKRISVWADKCLQT